MIKFKNIGQLKNLVTMQCGQNFLSSEFRPAWIMYQLSYNVSNVKLFEEENSLNIKNSHGQTVKTLSTFASLSIKLKSEEKSSL